LRFDAAGADRPALYAQVDDEALEAFGGIGLNNYPITFRVGALVALELEADRRAGGDKGQVGSGGSLRTV